MPALGSLSPPPRLSQDYTLYFEAEGKRPASCIVSCFHLTQTAPCLSDACPAAMSAVDPLRLIRGTVHQEDKLVRCTRCPGDTYPPGKMAGFRLWNVIIKRADSPVIDRFVNHCWLKNDGSSVSRPIRI